MPLEIDDTSGHELRLRFSERQSEVVIALQPLGKGVCNVHRFQDVEPEQILTVPIEKPLIGYYLGTGRHRITGIYQNVGREYCGLAMDLRLEVQIQAPEIVAPDETFTVTLSSSAFCRGVLIFNADANRHQPLARYLVALMSRLTALESEEDSGTGKTFSPTGECAETRFHQFRQMEIPQWCEIKLTAPQRQGSYRISVVATDGACFVEQDARIQVVSFRELHADFPEAVGPGDAVTASIDYRQPTPEILQIIRDGMVITEHTAENSGSQLIEVAYPGKWEVRLGVDRQEFQVHALDQPVRSCGDLRYLVEGADWSDGETMVYPHGIALSKNIIESLLADSYQGMETLTRSNLLRCQVV